MASNWVGTVPEGQAKALSVGCLATAALSGLNMVLPLGPTAPMNLDVVLCLVAVAFVAGVRLSRWRVSFALAQGVLVGATGAVSAAIAFAGEPDGAAVAAFGYVWVALFVAWFHTLALTLVHLGVAGIGLVAGLVWAGAPWPAHTWVFVMASLVTAAVAVNRLVRRLGDLARRDPLTGLWNRAAFAEFTELAQRRARRRVRPLTVAMIDLDGFKLVNDSLGHGAGDAVLRELAASWTSVLRADDVLARVGGDEFALLMPETDEEQARAVLSRLAGASAASGWTAGVAEWTGGSTQGWFAEADRNLYRGKPSRRPDGTRQPATR